MSDTLAIAEIRAGDRVRKDMGDLRALAESITKHGLLHPVVVMRDHTLVAGARRLEAARLLGWDEIPVTVVDVDDLLSAERDENTERKDFTPTEAVAIGRLIEEKARPRVQAQRLEKITAAARAHAERRRGGEESFTPSGRGQQLRDIAGAAVGMSGPTYTRAKAVVQAAEADPARFGDLPARMDETGQVEGAHRELRRRGGGNKKPTKAAPRHPIKRGTLHPRPNLEMQRAIAALGGICMGLESIEFDKLDPTKTSAWSEALKNAATTIGRIARRVANVKAA